MNTPLRLVGVPPSEEDVSELEEDLAAQRASNESASPSEEKPTGA